MKGYNFTERLRKVLAMAREEAALLYHPRVGTEHFLLGLLREGDGVGVTALQNLGADLGDIRQKLDETVESGDSNPDLGDLPYTAGAKRCLELAMSHSRQLNDSYVGTEHLLLGLISEKEGIAAQILVDCGATFEETRDEIRRILGYEMDTAAATAAGLVKPKSNQRPAPAPTVQLHEEVVQFGARLGEVVSLAHRVATDRACSKTTPVHLALALFEHGQGVAYTALDRLKVDISAATLELNNLAPTGAGDVAGPGSFDPDPAARRVLRTMMEVVQNERARIPETHHLLIALIAASPEVAAVFSAQRISLIDVRDEARKIVG